MQLVDSYLNEVRQFLPAANRDDILVELRSSLEEQVADHAEMHGRTATMEDEKSVLRQFGHPLKVASGYQSRRYLIGPALFPAFLQTLKLILVIVLSVQVALAVILSTSLDWSVSLSGLFAQALDTAFMVAAIVVAVFAGLEYSGEQLDWYHSWEPESLSAKTTRVIDRSDIITNLIFEGVFLLWWNDAIHLQDWIPVLGEQITLSLSGVWTPLYWPLNVVFSAFFVLHAYVLTRGLWHFNTLIAEVLLGVAALAIAIKLIASGTLVDLTSIGEELSFEWLQRTARITLVVIAGIAVWDIWTAIRLLRR